MVEAFRIEGIRVGFYYSLIDWHHPEFTIDRLHPMRDNEEMRATNQERDMTVYAEYVRNQVRELFTDFGQIDVLFLDFSYPGEDGKVKYAQLLNDASEINIANKQSAWMAKEKGFTESTLSLRLPVRKPDVVVPVIELFLE